jgi:hypothetical protein
VDTRYVYVLPAKVKATRKGKEEEEGFGGGEDGEEVLASQTMEEVEDSA